MHLLVNAAQAIGEGKASSNEIRIATSVDATGSVVVEIADTGPGIPEPVRSRIFDPFFTTKPVGTGVGLGLSICHSTLASFGGEIAAESTVGVGATFRVSLNLEETRPFSRTLAG